MEDSEEYLFWATQIIILPAKKEIVLLIKDENYRIVMRVANILKADPETPTPKESHKTKLLVVSKDSKPQLVSTSHLSNRARDPKKITSLYQIKNTKKKPS